MLLHHFLDWGSTELRWTDRPSPLAFRQPNYSLERQGDQDQVDQTVLAVGTAAARYLGRVPGSAQLYQPCVAGLPTDLGVAGRAGLAVLTQLGWVEPWWRSWLQVRTLIWAVPTQITAVEQAWFEQLARVWGYRRLELVPQGLAAANFWTGGQLTDTPLWVMDLGAEKTELAIVQGGAIVVGRTAQFGMSALVTAIQTAIVQTQQVEVSLAVASQVLQTIGTISTQISDQRELAVMGRSLQTQLPLVVTVTAQVLQPFLLAALQPLKTELQIFLSNLPATALTEVMQHGVSVSGGGAKLNGLGQWLQTTYQIICQQAKRPERVMIEGLIQTAAHTDHVK